MKRVITSLLLVCLLIPTFVLSANAQIFSGRALDDKWILEDFTGTTMDADTIEALQLAEYYRVEYSLDTIEGVLDIYCGKDENGEDIEQLMLPYARVNWIPWQNNGLMDYIKVARIHEGVMSAGRYSFYYAENLEEVYLPHSIRKINVTTFYQCENLKTVYYAGTEEDFANRILFDEVRNWYGEDANGNHTIEEEEVVFTLKDKIHYGESVDVICENEEGDVITSFTVGGYFVGDKYEIEPLEIEGLTYVGDEELITGKFKKNDSTVHVFTYHCDHEYAVTDPSKPCGSFCQKCGRVNPEPPAEHTWGETVVKSERGFLTPLEEEITCKVCEAKIKEYKHPYALYICIGVAVPVLLVGIAFAIIVPIRRKKRIKDLTW